MTAVAILVAYGAIRGRWGSPGSVLAYGNGLTQHLYAAGLAIIVIQALLAHFAWRGEGGFADPKVRDATHVYWIATFAYCAIVGAETISVLSTVRRGRRLAREVLRHDLQTRIRIREPFDFHIGLQNGKPIESCGLVSEDAVAKIEEALAPMRRNARVMITVRVHPAPASATLRAAMAARGDDPMSKDEAR